jgi:hypothetical protein
MQESKAMATKEVDFNLMPVLSLSRSLCQGLGEEKEKTP